MVATLPATTATITARNMIHAPTNELSGLGSTSLPTAPITTKAMRLNSPANAPTTNIHHHDKRATRPAATNRVTRPGWTVGVFVTPEAIWSTNPPAVTRRAVTVSLPAVDNELRVFIGPSFIAFASMSVRMRRRAQ